MPDKKKFKDTKFGGFLNKVIKVVPDVSGAILDVASGDFNGAIDKVKNALNIKAKKNPESKEIQALQMEFQKMQNTFKKEMYELEVADRDSARKRQIEVAKTGKKDLLYNISGFIGLGVFAFVVYSIIFLEVPKGNKEIFIHLIGIVEGVALSIFGFFFGTSDTEKKNK